MNRQPPAFLERLVGKLIPAASREHVLGDLSERYTSPSHYVVDATRTIPFVVIGQWQRAGRAAMPSIQTGALRVSIVAAFFGIFYVIALMDDEMSGATTPRWFPAAFMLLMMLYPTVLSLQDGLGESLCGNESPSSLWTQKQTLRQRMAKQQRRMKTDSHVTVCISAVPFLSIASAWMSHLPIPTLDGRFVAFSLTLAMLCTFLVVMERAHHHRVLRSLQQQLDSLA